LSLPLALPLGAFFQTSYKSIVPQRWFFLQNLKISGMEITEKAYIKWRLEN